MVGNYEERFLNMGYGSAQPNISPKLIESIPQVYPSSKVLSPYNTLVLPVMNKIIANNTECLGLVELKNSLLNKLFVL